MSQPVRISLVIPAFDEEKFLGRLLDSIEVARSCYVHGAEAIEVIVADNASTDDTAEVAARHGCRVIRVEKRAIAAARNGGARAAKGDIVAFVDADTVRVHPETFNAIEKLMAPGRYVGGATGVTMERWSAGILSVYLVMLPFVWLTGMDTGVVFCRRDAFEATGGYDERRLIAEDVAFLFALRRVGRRSGRRLVRARSVKAVASTRKFDQYGDWHYLRMMPGLVAGAALGTEGSRRFIQRYWYQPRR